MFTTYDCDICGRSFKTNQHLTQHKNRKNKCKPSADIEKPSTQVLPVQQPTDTNNMNSYSVPELIQLVLSYKTAIDKINELEEVVAQLRYDIREKERLIDNLKKSNPIYRGQTLVASRVRETAHRSPLALPIVVENPTTSVPSGETPVVNN